MLKQAFVYILANYNKGTLYVGVTNDLTRRAIEHKLGEENNFTKKYKVNKLVYYEEIAGIEMAILREKRIKKWRRQWKLNLIKKFNPEWKDLAEYLHETLVK
jgi:putative endonuclease